MSLAQSIERGRYGPYPSDAAPRRLVWPTRLLGLAVGHLTLFGLCSRRSMFRLLDAGEREILDEVTREVSFRTVSLDCAPNGFVLCRCETVPNMSDLVTLLFRASSEPSTDCRAMSLSQRKAWLPLLEELELARVPFTRVRDGGTECYLVHGVYGGEPIDHAYWCWTQRSLAFEINGIVCELRGDAAHGPGLATMLAFVRKIERATEAAWSSQDATGLAGGAHGSFGAGTPRPQGHLA
jgi:hypothetical protein